MQFLRGLVVLGGFLLTLLSCPQNVFGMKGVAPDSISHEQMISNLKEQLKETEIISEETYNGVTSLSLKNSEEYIWFFLGATGVLAVAIIGKAVCLLAGDSEKKDELQASVATVVPPSASTPGGEPVVPPVGVVPPAEQQPVPRPEAFQFDRGPIHVRVDDGHVRLRFDGAQPVGGPAPVGAAGLEDVD